MDEMVEKALAKWPNVPHCYGWLGLDARGQWFLRDDATQAAGAFPAAKGTRLEHGKLIEFIGRNYACDEAGQWFFQNGPQRVYVELEVAPWVWRLAGSGGNGDEESGAVQSHTGQPVEPTACLTDAEGRVYLATGLGLGLVHTLDVGLAAEAIEQRRWTPEDVASADLPARFGFVRSPAARHAEVN